MSMTLEDAWLEEAYDQMVQEILAEHRDEIIDEFVSERMASYFRQHVDLLSPASAALAEARKLQEISASACVVFAHSAIEIALRDAILKPVVYGMVHEENSGHLIAELVVGKRQFTKLLFSVLEDYGLDLKTGKRSGSAKSVWEEMEVVREQRNKVAHRGEVASGDDAMLALSLAEFVVEKISPYLQKTIAQQ